MVDFCCEKMKNNIYYTEKEFSDYDSDKIDNVIYYASRFNEYGIPVRDGYKGSATSFILIQYCPWCGKKLPESRRDEWFAILEELGYEGPLGQDDIPEKYKTNEWYIKK